MRTRLYDPKDYDTVAPWWKAHGWDSVPQAIIPQCGVIVESSDGYPYAAAWMFQDNTTCVAWMEWTVTNPANKPKDSVRAITILINGMKEIAHGLGRHVLITATKTQSLVRLYEKNGFQKSDEGMTHMVMRPREAK